MHKWVLAAGLMWSAWAWAAIEGPGRTQFIQAARTTGPIAADGRLDEAAWAQAPVFDAFVQRFPGAGQVPSERTELRVLYDDRNVYFALTCHDSQPALINRNLGRRDSDLFTDKVEVLLDTTHDHRRAYAFSVSAGGVQGDGLYYDDSRYTSEWDGIWDGAAELTADGWVAELTIPLSLLRFPEAPLQTWGFSVRRQIARKNEELETVDNPRTSGAVVSRLGHLTGLERLQPRQSLEVVPYLAARSVARPQYSDASRPFPRLVDPSLDVGLDLRAALTSDLALTATVNPDFSQVDADRLLLNLTNFEVQFPEKRPFFNEGLELFQPVGGSMGPTNHALFYSRRIGLTTPVLGAVKLTGTVAEGVDVSLLDAVVTGPWQSEPVDEDAPDRSLRLDLSRPLHLGTSFSVSTVPQIPMNYLAAVVRGNVLPGSRVGAAVTTATPLTGGCTEEQEGLDVLPVSCLARGGNAAALDFDLRTEDGAYGLIGQVEGSHVTGGIAERTLRDGTLLRRGGTGLGGYLRAGKFGGEGLRWDAGYDYSSPTLELNSSGFQATQNEHAVYAGLNYQRPNGMGALRSFSANLYGGAQWTSDGRGLMRGRWASLRFDLQLPSFDSVGVESRVDSGGFDVRELRGTGIPLENARSYSVTAFAETNARRMLTLASVLSVGRRHSAGPVPAAATWQARLVTFLRPHPTLETRLDASWERMPYGPRFLGSLGQGRFLFSPLTSNTLSLTLRQQWLLMPRLSLQTYAQLFTAYGVYNGFLEGASDADRSPVRFASLLPVEQEGPEGFRDVGMNINVVLRWEYRLGSTLYLVYTRGQTGLPVPDDVRLERSLLPSGLLSGPAQDSFMVKWAWFWGR
ncbi:DUF5916 domain-containing protein [Myxococcaceae bacterium GXIMD 01537]